MRITSAAFISLATLTAACSGNPAPTAPAPQRAPAAAPAAAAPAPTPAAPASTTTTTTTTTTTSATTGAADMSGSWVATLDMQGQTIAVNVSLTRGPNGYTGEAAPEGQTGAALSSLTLQGDRLTMTFGAPDGDAVFSGTLAADRRAATGTLSYQGQTIPFTMTKH